MDDAVVDVKDLRKAYGAVQALRGVSFTVQPGEVVAILGPNGAGKTTLVEILEGFRTRDSGDVRVLGTDPAHGGGRWRQRIGVVLQDSAFDEYLTAAEILQMHAEYYVAPRRVDEVLSLIGLEEKAGSRARSLSGGQRRRLDVGLGLIGDPELLFLDEPTTGFDPSARRQAWTVVHNLATLGKTVILTTHYMDEAQQLADRAVVVAAGQIVAEGPPDALGGRQQGLARIRFTLADGIDVESLPVEARHDEGGTMTIETDDPTTVLHQLTGWAVRRKRVLIGLTVERPTLEDVYLELTSAPPADGPGGGR